MARAKASAARGGGATGRRCVRGSAVLRVLRAASGKRRRARGVLPSCPAAPPWRGDLPGGPFAVLPSVRPWGPLVAPLPRSSAGVWGPAVDLWSVRDSKQLTRVRGQTREPPGPHRRVPGAGRGPLPAALGCCVPVTSPVPGPDPSPAVRACSRRHRGVSLWPGLASLGRLPQDRPLALPQAALPGARASPGLPGGPGRAGPQCGPVC